MKKVLLVEGVDVLLMESKLGEEEKEEVDVIANNTSQGKML